MTPRIPGVGQEPRSMLLSGHQGTLPDAALLEVMLGDRSAQIARDVLERHPIPHGLWRISAEDLTRHAGVGPAGAARVLACLELSRRAASWPSSPRPVVSGASDVVRLCEPRLRGLDREHFWALALNTRNQLLRTVEVSVGSLNASIVHPRELFKEAVRLSAAAVVVLHNHPSGDPTPSGADIQLTRRLVRAGDVLGIEVLDHVVVADGGEYASLRDLGLM